MPKSLMGWVWFSAAVLVATTALELTGVTGFSRGLIARFRV